MCRFAAYFSHEEIILDEILAKPQNSLIKQSHEAREGTHGINADGFGMAWYNFDISNEPAIFKSIQPAWNDNNLAHLSQKMKSSCFLAHVRASTVGDVNQNNCHPFSYNEYSFVHNGTIRNFDHYKKILINKIDEDLFLHIKGNTDSEYFFFLIMHFIRHDNNLETAVKKAIEWVVYAQKDAEEFSRINIVITNGDELMATRFVSKEQKSLSFKYSSRLQTDNETIALILSSEALDDDEEAWHELPENHYIYLNKNNMQVKLGTL